jgi:hypothetical protein
MHIIVHTRIHTSMCCVCVCVCVYVCVCEERERERETERERERERERVLTSLIVCQKDKLYLQVSQFSRQAAWATAMCKRQRPRSARASVRQSYTNILDIFFCSKYSHFSYYVEVGGMWDQLVLP